MDRRKIKIIDGMEIGNTHVQLDNGVKLAVVGEGKYHTLGNPKERWAEVAEVRILPDGEYGDGELLGWTPLLSSGKRKAHIMPKGNLQTAAKGNGRNRASHKAESSKVLTDRALPNAATRKRRTSLSQKADSPIWNRAAAPKS